jgi:excisionase family DNA binding protein
VTALSEMPDVLTVEETAVVLRCGRSACYSAVKAGQIPSIKVGRRILVPRHRLEALLGLSNSEGPATDRAIRETNDPRRSPNDKHHGQSI